MKDNKNKDIPLIVNGELNIGKKRVVKEKKLPTKRFGMLDIFLTLIGIVLVIYGVYTITNKDKEDSENSNIQEQKTDIRRVDYKRLITFSDEEINIYSSEDYIGMKNGLTANNLSNNAKLALASKVAIKDIYNEKTCITATEMDNSIKYLFGDISYTSESFIVGNRIYTYNQETKRYYLMSNINKNLTYIKYDYIEKNEMDDTLIITDYVAYTFEAQNRTISITKQPVEHLITNANIQQDYNLLEHYEYKFIKKDNRYILESITIK